MHMATQNTGPGFEYVRLDIGSYSINCIAIADRMAIWKITHLLGFTRAALVAQLVKNLPAMQKTLV